MFRAHRKHPQPANQVKAERAQSDTHTLTGLPGGGLGNNLETLIGPGDSGGPLLLANGNGYSLVGLNTFVEGCGGKFGDNGGGVVFEPYHGWVTQTTGIAVPEPASASLTVASLVLVGVARRR